MGSQVFSFSFCQLAQGRDYDHRLMGFNNDPETSFEEIGQVYQIAEEAVTRRMGLQATCEL